MKPAQEVLSGSLSASLKQRRALMSTKELADLFNVSNYAIYRLVKRAKIPSLRLGGHIRFDPQIIASWIETKNSLTINKANKTVWYIDSD